MISTRKIRCKMARIQNEKYASEELNVRILTVDGEVRNPTIKEEFVQVIKEFKIPVEKVFIDSLLEEFFSKTSKMSEYKATSTQCTNMPGKRLIL